MSDYFETPICPNCGATIEEDCTIDETYDVNSINFTVLGTCPNCGKNYRWTDHYEHTHNDDLEDITED